MLDSAMVLMTFTVIEFGKSGDLSLQNENANSYYAGYAAFEAKSVLFKIVMFTKQQLLSFLIVINLRDYSNKV